MDETEVYDRVWFKSAATWDEASLRNVLSGLEDQIVRFQKRAQYIRMILNLETE